MRPEFRTAASALAPAARTVRTWGGERGLTIIGWHRVDPVGRGLSTSVTEFERHLDVLEEWGALVLPLEEAHRRLARGTLPPRAVVLTFDDGYASVVETAWPLLRKREMPASLFVVSDYLCGTRAFSWDAGDDVTPEERRLVSADALVAAHRDGLHLGSHTVTHPWLPALDDVELDRQLRASRETISDLVGETVTSLAYPTGGWNRRVRAAAGRAGYEIAITVNRGYNRRGTHPLSLRRAFVPADHRDLRLILDGAYTFLRPLDSWRGRRGPTE